MSGRDRQRARVYAWEDRVVAPHAPDRIPFSAAQSMVDAIWAGMGLRWPPKVERLPGQASVREADATRLRLRLPEALPSWVLLHELAHSMTSTAEGNTDGHGPRFMGLYLQLLERYLRLPATSLLPSLREARIEVDLTARPVFLDALAP
ncbi:hypothetical protein D9599_28860 [Roseomonas sp. KE2513]|uniref:hypothetical protein n=1 Tax=Roseomonas sp. KE2513 TaxID=2479202 RepID=UPI0018E06060|nr:hypothetical protein [Roseomonas sp. KE2513]MBI0539523.1 hypothetical protein [Roseomonas sp. KE2513]